MSKSKHFRERQAKRGLREQVLEFLLTFGTEIKKAGARFYVLYDRQYDGGAERNLWELARHWVVVVSDDGCLLTCYRGRNVHHHINRKSKIDRSANIALARGIG